MFPNPLDSAFVDVTPRRLHNFEITAGEIYSWENVQMPDSLIIQSGTVEVDAFGLITVQDFKITNESNWLRLFPVEIMNPPDNITIYIESDIINIEWDEVEEASSYKIYSSNDPYESSENWILEADGISGTSWSEVIADDLKFYYVVASTDETRRNHNKQEFNNDRKTKISKYSGEIYRKQDKKKMKFTRKKKTNLN